MGRKRDKKQKLIMEQGRIKRWQTIEKAAFIVTAVFATGKIRWRK